MADQFVEVKRTGYGTRIGRSFGTMLAGILLFFASFGVLYWNEGRADLSVVAKTAVEIQSAGLNQDASLAGKLVSTSGNLLAGPALGDLYIKPDRYVALKRLVEMYAWKEITETKKQTEAGGAEVETTTYKYQKAWTETPADSSQFHYPNDHYNPAKKIASASKRAAFIKVGAYELDAKTIDLPDLAPLALLKETLDAKAVKAAKGELVGDYIYTRLGAEIDPKVGDLRISYAALKSGLFATVFGALDGNRIVKYVDKDNNLLYRAFEGTREEAISTLRTEYIMSLWLGRVGGFVMMWLGLSMAFSLLTTLVDVLPFLGSLGKFVVGTVTFVVALALSVITILISILLHNIVALVIVAVIVVGGGLALKKLAPKKKAA